MIQFHPSRSKALEQLQSFVENHLGLYARDRNFDFGPEKRKNTSCLSPYVTHGILQYTFGGYAKIQPPLVDFMNRFYEVERIALDPI